MKKVFFALGTGIMVLTGSSPAAAVAAGKRFENIVIIGDSLAAGFGATSPLYRPMAFLKKLAPVHIHDLSVSGSRSRQVLLQAQAAKALKPDLVFVSSGGNDALSDALLRGSYPASQSVQQMDEIFSILKSTGARVVYLGLDIPLTGGERLTQISKSARKHGVIVFDGMAGLWGDKKLMRDEIHPNDAGYKLLGERLLEAVRAAP